VTRGEQPLDSRYAPALGCPSGNVLRQVAARTNGVVLVDSGGFSSGFVGSAPLTRASWGPDRHGCTSTGCARLGHASASMQPDLRRPNLTADFQRKFSDWLIFESVSAPIGDLRQH
jgi:hypothetical protein